ncbi:MAG TPA: helix-turn-helix domain-containing protein [Mucilaginibacter sp.]|jgi:hypothetical protein
MDTNHIQQSFFSHIRSKLPLHLSFVDEVAELLNISNDSAYRRIRGEKPISLDEAYVLCNKYNVSIDQLFQLSQNSTIFSFHRADNLSTGFNRYLEFVENSLRIFKSMDNPRIIFHNRDVLIFHMMQFPELNAFKFFFWKRTLMSYPEMARQQFVGEETDEGLNESTKRIVTLYHELPTTDIFCDDCINITIRQIEIYRQSNVFADKHLLIKVYTQLEEMLNHLEMQTEAGKKFLYNQPVSLNSAPYEVYVNEWLMGDNTAYVADREKQISFINLVGLNFISTYDKNFGEHISKSLQNIIRKSTLISEVGEKERRIFFNKLREKIHERVRSI